MIKKFKKVILISDRQADLNFLNLLAKKLDLDFSNYSNLAANPVIEEDYLVFVDSSSEQLFIQYEQYTRNLRQIYSHFISDDQIHNQRHVPRSHTFAGFIQRGESSIEELVNQYTLAIQSPSIELLSLSPINFKTINFTKTNQKLQAIEKVAEDLRDENVGERIIAIVSNAVDEIVMNSMFDSKVNDIGEQVYRYTPRTAVFNLKNKSSVALKYAISSEYIILSSTDYFGSFDKEKFYDYIARIKTQKDFSRAEVGAGLGLAQIFLSGGSVFLYCEPGKKTEVFVLFKKTNSVAELKSHTKFITSSMAIKEVA